MESGLCFRKHDISQTCHKIEKRKGTYSLNNEILTCDISQYLLVALF
jgi:hypothetical protein